jgi:hypothetical protein
VQYRYTPWVDWSSYWGTGDLSSLPKGYFSTSIPTFRGVNGALLDLEYERIELLHFNLFDNNLAYQDYVEGRDGRVGASIKVWPQMRLPQNSPYYAAVGGDGAQLCKGELIRGRTLTGVCNDIKNPLMGSLGTPFARNVEFETTFPDLEQNELTKNRHGGRINLMTPDPQVISRKLFTRLQSPDNGCNQGFGSPTFSTDSNCDYQKAPFFNVLAAYWIQFMTHDWFSHMEEGHNAPALMNVGCASAKVNGAETPLSTDDVQKLGCRPTDQVDRAIVQQDAPPQTFTTNGHTYLTRAPKTFRLRRDVGEASEARSQRSCEVADGGSAGAAGWISTNARTGRSVPAAVDRTGGDGVSRQLDHRDELLPQSVRSRTQLLCGRVPQTGSGEAECR